MRKDVQAVLRDMERKQQFREELRMQQHAVHTFRFDPSCGHCQAGIVSAAQLGSSASTNEVIRIEVKVGSAPVVRKAIERALGCKVRTPRR